MEQDNVYIIYQEQPKYSDDLYFYGEKLFSKFCRRKAYDQATVSQQILMVDSQGY